MSIKSKEDRFSIELDAYFKGLQECRTSNTQEYNELLELGKNLADQDFSKNSNKKAVLNKILEKEKLINERKGIMKNSNKTKKIAITAASFLTVCAISTYVIQPAYAHNIATKIIKTISLGHVSTEQFKDDKVEKIPVPAEFKGKVFDKDGKPLVELSKKSPKMYTASGEEIICFTNGEPVTKNSKSANVSTLEVKDVNEINNHTCFKVLLPNYLPEGYKFDKAIFFKESAEDTVVNTKYVDLSFINEKNGKQILIQQRYPDETTRVESGTDAKVQKIKVNGADAIFIASGRLSWETNNALYFLRDKGNLDMKELIKIAESIK